MFTKKFMIRFGSGDPRTFAVASPTFTYFYNAATGVSLTAPGITAIFPLTGQYWFDYGATQPIGFLIDGGASLVGDYRYIAGTLDPIQSVDGQLGTVSTAGVTNITGQIALISAGSSSLASLIGGVTSPIGTTSVGASTLFGQLNRTYEFLAGDKDFNKSLGVWSVYDRGGSILIETKTLGNDVTGATSI